MSKAKEKEKEITKGKKGVKAKKEGRKEKEERKYEKVKPVKDFAEYEEKLVPPPIEKGLEIEKSREIRPKKVHKQKKHKIILTKLSDISYSKLNSEVRVPKLTLTEGWKIKPPQPNKPSSKQRLKEISPSKLQKKKRYELHLSKVRSKEVQKLDKIQPLIQERERKVEVESAEIKEAQLPGITEKKGAGGFGEMKKEFIEQIFPGWQRIRNKKGAVSILLPNSTKKEPEEGKLIDLTRLLEILLQRLYRERGVKKLIPTDLKKDDLKNSDAFWDEQKNRFVETDLEKYEEGGKNTENLLQILKKAPAVNGAVVMNCERDLEKAEKEDKKDDFLKWKLYFDYIEKGEQRLNFIPLEVNLMDEELPRKLMSILLSERIEAAYDKFPPIIRKFKSIGKKLEKSKNKIQDLGLSGKIRTRDREQEESNHHLNMKYFTFLYLLQKEAEGNDLKWETVKDKIIEKGKSHPFVKKIRTEDKEVGEGKRADITLENRFVYEIETFFSEDGGDWKRKFDKAKSYADTNEVEKVVFVIDPTTAFLHESEILRYLKKTLLENELIRRRGGPDFVDIKVVDCKKNYPDLIPLSEFRKSLHKLEEYIY